MYLKSLIFSLIFLLITNFIQAQNIENSFILLSNHTSLQLTVEARISGDDDMVDVGRSEIRPWEGSNYHDLNDRIVTTILDIVFSIDVQHKNSPNLVKLKRSNFSGGNNHQVEIDILNQEDLLFTILYDYTGISNSFRNLSNYNIRYPDGSLDAIVHYSLLNENGNNPHRANRDIEINGVAYKLIYGSFDNALDPTNNIIFSLSEKEPVSLHLEPNIEDLEDPTILNVLTYNIGLLMPLNANDQDERERIPVMHQAIPKNMDIIMWQEMFEQYFVNQLIDSLSEFYPYHTSPHNRASIPGFTKNGGCLIMSKYPILEELDYSYERDGGITANGESVLADKGVKYAKIDKGGQIIHVFNSHTSGQSIENDAMGRFIKETVQPNYDDVVIMGGDMNTKIFIPKYHQMIDSLEAIQPTYKSLQNDQVQMQGTTWGYNHFGGGRSDTASFIDYVFVNQNFKVPLVYYNETQTYRLNITDKEFWGIFDLGDHQPVYARMEFPTIEASISDTNVCPNESFQIDVSTSLDEYAIEWYKDGILLPSENQLTLSRNNIAEEDWGKYDCYLLYGYSPDEVVNNTPTFHPPYVSQGETQGRLLRSFNVGPRPDICEVITSVANVLNETISVYPNPANRVLNIDFAETISNCKDGFKIYNSLLELVHKGKKCSSSKISIESWTDGIYTIKYDAGKDEITMQFVKITP